MKPEKKERKVEEDRKNYYAGIAILLSTAQQNLAGYAFKTLLNSVRGYMVKERRKNESCILGISNHYSSSHLVSYGIYILSSRKISLEDRERYDG